MSNRSLGFTQKGWETYLYWQQTDKKMVRKINKLISEIQRTPFSGSGKPEALKENLSGYWSRRIDDQHRLVYKVTASQIEIASCRYHYK